MNPTEDDHLGAVHKPRRLKFGHLRAMFEEDLQASTSSVKGNIWGCAEEQCVAPKNELQALYALRQTRHPEGCQNPGYGGQLSLNICGQKRLRNNLCPSYAKKRKIHG